MASISAAALSAAAAAIACSGARRAPTVRYVGGLNSFSGLKADNEVSSLGQPTTAARSFAKVASSLRAPPKGKRSSGGALSTTCNAAGEIFQIAAIMNGLVLVGVGVGFVLLRVEAWVEESE
ncbi:uncharacterized protein LOC122031973 [Zingiber officinale]|uniref:uncharacterized protein LOC122031973 n=1 Tax=Zingiber officinale TaxID=94328 RepID=UPI001C4BD603|nr:uncharacterized protein LOC122031973 [Zingiber officinale]